MKQAFMLVIMGLASTRARLGLSLVVTMGVGCAVLVLVSLLSIGSGIESMSMRNVRMDRVIVRNAGESTRGALTQDQLQTIAALPGIKRSPGGEPLVSPDVTVVVQARKERDRIRSNLTALGVDRLFNAVHPEIRIVRGRTFAAGTYELIVGAAARKVYQNLDVGDHLTVRGARWEIVGSFEANGGLAETWVLGDANTLKTAFDKPGYAQATLQLESPDAFDRFVAAVDAMPGMDLEVEREVQARRRQTRTMSAMTNFVSYFVSTIMAIGAAMGALGSMYAIVDSRRRELATLQALGFSTYAVFGAVLLEALILAMPGGVLGIALPWLAINDAEVSFVGLNFSLLVTAELAAMGLLWTCIIAVLGGLLPAFRAARISVAQALRG